MAAPAWLERAWWSPERSAWSTLAWPVEQLYRALAALKAAMTSRGRVPVPVIVVGNLVVGGAGKTPTVIAIVQALQRAGRRPGVISRGYGSGATAPRPVHAGSRAEDCGDEPLLIRHRTGVPVWVGTRRVAVAQALCAARAEVDVIVSDDGRQHAALPRTAEVLVFDARGVGNGRLLPAGPLREPLPARLPANVRALYNAPAPSTPLPGDLAVRALPAAWPLHAWSRGDASATRPLAAWRGTPLHAAAGIAEPERFFGMLRAQGLTFTEWPLPDHHDYATRPWPDAPLDVLITEKDAVKLAARAGTAARLWVVPLDFVLPASLEHWLIGMFSDSPTALHSDTPP
ncbi:MAG: tetraacyldisaccharide 4'-kinase [Rubrivivax sp.]|nr:tetraacyldisaccharide 4'-kinase [Rubrivivax sp.]